MYIRWKEYNIVIQHVLQIRLALQIKKNMLTYNKIRPIYMYDRNILKYFSKFQIVYDTFFKYVHLKIQDVLMFSWMHLIHGVVKCNNNHITTGVKQFSLDLAYDRKGDPPKAEILTQYANRSSFGYSILLRRKHAYM